MRWDASPGGGFSSGDAWLPLGDARRNVAALQADERSILWLYRRLLRLRRSEPALLTGDYEPVRSRGDILTYRRTGPGGAILVALNIVHDPRKLECSCQGKLLLSTHLDRADEAVCAPRLLRPSEGIIVRLA